MKKLIFLFTLISIFAFAKVETTPPQDASEVWVNSIMKDMNIDEMIGQLFMIRAHSDKGPEHIKEVKRQIKKYKVGGLCFFQGTPMKQAKLTNEYQSLSEIPLMIAIDGEWGLGMRFPKSAISFPKQLTLGAIKHNDVIYEMGAEIAQQLKRIGVHMNFAPVVDVNNNPANPVIHNRSFGEDIFNVSAKSYSYMKGMQDAGIFACAKHFPGHGDTSVDSHYDLPVINHSLSRLDSIELMPFKSLVQLGVRSIMTAHLQVPALDDRPNRPTSLSKKVITGILKEDMGFKGLIITDALEMQGVAKHFTIGESSAEALKAGNDIVLMPIDIDQAIKGVKQAFLDGEIDSISIAAKVKKVLRRKHILGLDEMPFIKYIDRIPEEINNPKAITIKTKLYEEAITFVKGENLKLPIEDIKAQKISVLSLGRSSTTPFQKRIKSYANSDLHVAGENISKTEQVRLKQKLSVSDLVIISLHDLNIYSGKKFGLSQSQLDLIFQLNSQNKILLVNFGSPYALQYFRSIPNIVQAYEEDDICQDVTAQIIMGALAFKGTLPVSVGEDFPYRLGIQTRNLGRLKYGTPERVGMNADSLLEIDKIIKEMIAEKAAPGCQIMAIKSGQVVYEKAFGYQTFNKKKKVNLDHIYDVASVTKILATTISLMRLEMEEKLNINQKIDTYLPEIDTSNKGDLIIQDVMAHHGKLPGWIAFYKATLEEEKKKMVPSKHYYRASASDSFCLEVTNDLFLRCDYRDSIYSRIYGCKLRDKANYKYSDLGFYLFHQIIERISGKNLDEYTEDNFYNDLGLSRTCFNAIKKFPRESIAPSEKDDYFRYEVVQGYVHDMGAAMLGGVSGHAGLFSNAKELGIIMQMLLNGGHYGGKQFLDPLLIRKYTKRHPRSTRRGLGFDMKELDANKTLNMSELASDGTFGHLGFTGTAVFADPDNDLIYIFISNRTYPTMKNYKFSKNEYRPRVQSVFYKAMEKNKV